MSGGFGCAVGFERFGAKVRVDGRTLSVAPGSTLRGAAVEAPDLRGGAALVLAALAASGTSVITHPEHIDRGYAAFYGDFGIFGGTNSPAKRHSETRPRKKPLQKSKIILQSGQKDGTIQLYKCRFDIILCETLRSTITSALEDKRYGTHA